MQSLRLEDLLAQGYMEDPVAKRLHSRRQLRFFAPPAAMFVAGLLLGGWRVIPGLVCAAWLCLAVAAFGIGFLVLLRMPLKSRHTGKRMILYRNSHPDGDVLAEEIYVCHDSKTFFRVAFERSCGD